MTSRLNPFTAQFEAVKPLIDFGNFTQDGLDPTIAELIKIRASQINGCAPCLAMHTRDARNNGESEERLYLLDAWRESSLYSDAERAVLEWTETLTSLSPASASEEAYQALKTHFNDEEVVKITMLICIINSFNRVNIGFHVPHTFVTAQEAA